MIQRTGRLFYFFLLLYFICLAKVSAEPIKHFGAGLSFHKEMYLMPATWADDYHGDETEVVFQLSAKQRIFTTDFYFAYTQKSFWQAYNTDESSPFRETNYNPEMFYRVEPGKLSSWGLGENGFIRGLGFDIGFEHESNGQSLPLSRSWNRIYFTPCYENDNFLVTLKLSYRLPEDNKEDPDDTEGDDNPDITDYYGIGELNIFQQINGKHMLHLMTRGNFRTGKGAVAVTYSYPWFTGNTFFMLKGFHGYGESLADYNESISRISVGVMFSR